MRNRDVVIPILSTIISILLICSVGSTLAWYQYTSNVFSKYDGTSIGSSKIFDIGLVSETRLEEPLKHGFKEDLTNSNIYWASSGISSDMSAYYSKSNGYAVNEVNGVTSGKYETNGEFYIKRAPYHNENYLDHFGRPIKANKKDYVHFDFVFRIKEVTSDDIIQLKSGNIYLSKIELESTGNLKQAMRIHMDNKHNNYIFAPFKINDGIDTVGGLLDLNRDGLYDHSPYTRKEIFYGESNGGVVYKDTLTTDGYDSAQDISDDSFTGLHRNGVYAVDEAKTEAATSSYLGYDSVLRDKKILTTIEEETGLAYLSVDIYLEGWDRSFIDREMGSYFSLNLEFAFNA